MIGCREHININAPLPNGFRTELIGFNKMKVHGKGSVKDFESILQNIEYQNELFTPTPGKRKVHISIAEEKTKLQSDFWVVIRMEPNKKPVITLQGCKDINASPKRLREIGVPLCSNFNITYHGCSSSMNSPVNTVELLDKAVVKVFTCWRGSHNVANRFNKSNYSLDRKEKERTKEERKYKERRKEAEKDRKKQKEKVKERKKKS